MCIIQLAPLTGMMQDTVTQRQLGCPEVSGASLWLAYMKQDLWKAQRSSLFVSGAQVGCPRVSEVTLDT